MVAHSRSASGGLCFVLKFRLDQIYSFGYSAVYIFWHFGILAYSRPLFGRFGAYFPQMTLAIVLTSKTHLPARKHVV